MRHQPSMPDSFDDQAGDGAAKPARSSLGLKIVLLGALAPFGLYALASGAMMLGQTPRESAAPATSQVAGQTAAPSERGALDCASPRDAWRGACQTASPPAKNEADRPGTEKAAVEEIPAATGAVDRKPGARSSTVKGAASDPAETKSASVEAPGLALAPRAPADGERSVAPPVPLTESALAAPAPKSEAAPKPEALLTPEAAPKPEPAAKAPAKLSIRKEAAAPVVLEPAAPLRLAAKPDDSSGTTKSGSPAESGARTSRLAGLSEPSTVPTGDVSATKNPLEPARSGQRTSATKPEAARSDEPVPPQEATSPARVANAPADWDTEAPPKAGDPLPAPLPGPPPVASAAAPVATPPSEAKVARPVEAPVVSPPPPSRPKTAALDVPAQEPARAAASTTLAKPQTVEEPPTPERAAPKRARTVKPRDVAETAEEVEPVAPRSLRRRAAIEPAPVASIRKRPSSTVVAEEAEPPAAKPARSRVRPSRVREAERVREPEVAPRRSASTSRPRPVERRTRIAQPRYLREPGPVPGGYTVTSYRTFEYPDGRRFVMRQRPRPEVVRELLARHAATTSRVYWLD